MRGRGGERWSEDRRKSERRGGRKGERGQKKLRGGWGDEKGGENKRKAGEEKGGERTDGNMRREKG